MASKQSKTVTSLAEITSAAAVGSILIMLGQD
jgi:hypothetical protein